MSAVRGETSLTVMSFLPSLVCCLSRLHEVWVVKMASSTEIFSALTCSAFCLVCISGRSRINHPMVSVGMALVLTSFTAHIYLHQSQFVCACVRVCVCVCVCVCVVCVWCVCVCVCFTNGT